MATDGPDRTKDRINAMLRAICTLLAETSDGMNGTELIELVKAIVPPTASENTLNASGIVRYVTNLRFWSIDLVKAGWVSKVGGVWTLTEVGCAALASYPGVK